MLAVPLRPPPRPPAALARPARLPTRWDQTAAPRGGRARGRRPAAAENQGRSPRGEAGPLPAPPSTALAPQAGLRSGRGPYPEAPRPRKPTESVRGVRARERRRRSLLREGRTLRSLVTASDAGAPLGRRGRSAAAAGNSEAQARARWYICNSNFPAFVYPLSQRK